MTREELIKIRDAETWTEVQEEVDKLFEEYKEEVLADGWESVNEFFEFGNWEIFVENIIDRELKEDEDEDEGADLFQQMGLESESMGAWLGKALNIRRR